MMIAIPEMTGADVAFGNIKHMPSYSTIPNEFKTAGYANPYVMAVSKWFFKGAEFEHNTLTVDGVDFHPKPGVNATKALAAIRAVLCSFEPKHEHKTASCAFMLSEWFHVDEPKKGRAAKNGEQG